LKSLVNTVLPTKIKHRLNEEAERCNLHSEVGEWVILIVQTICYNGCPSIIFVDKISWAIEEHDNPLERASFVDSTGHASDGILDR